MNRRSAQVVVAAFAGLALLAACSGSSGSSEPEATGGGTAGAAEGGGEIDFWSQIYGDPAAWRSLMEELAADFEEETGTTVKLELIDFAQARDRWLLVSQGGDAPDAADMFQLTTYAPLGGGKAGPMPITEYKDEYWSDMDERFFASMMVDGEWQGEFYGIPWRVDIRPMLYRTDLLEQAGLDAPPATWEEIEEYGATLTQGDTKGFSFGGVDVIQGLIPYYWQTGSEYMSEDGATANLDTPEMRETLTWLSGLVEAGIVPQDFMSPTFDPMAEFRSGRIAILGGASAADIATLTREYPELDGKWAIAPPAKGPDNSAAYSGSGYWGVLQGTDSPDEAVEWIAYLSRDENMQKIAETIGFPSTNRSVMASPAFTDAEWKTTLTEVIEEHAHTSQAPSPFWTVIRDEAPGGVLWDMFSAVLETEGSVDDAIATAQERMQTELDRGKTS
ncbi:extracellular solute-binding protein [Georgenia yuyongxinii]|uniref:Extracellular solute-binding protein n=1 Tax=Georgenia yuyongxinii TaxID=2589797 RepID=A0A552WPT3_9MICO|nr:extracellular solute-binding protein [Georgenia yuyongxinii]TRW44503.1 extracellular solute-binding protein [Georgenia yuyongxinii]